MNYGAVPLGGRLTINPVKLLSLFQKHCVTSNSFLKMLILLAWKHGIKIKVLIFFFARLFLGRNSPSICSLGDLTKGHNSYREAAEGQQQAVKRKEQL